VAADTLVELDEKGYCLWTCQHLAAVICVVKDSNVVDASGHLTIPLQQFSIMQRYPVYTVTELEILASHPSLWLERMVLEAKRTAGAVVQKTEDIRKKKPGREK